jgi:membrane fusion protein (multidrug efflux system)
MDSRSEEVEGARPGATPRIEVVRPPAPANAVSPPKQGNRRVVAVAALAVAVLAAVVYWLDRRRFEETDDAQIDGDISNLSPRVAGTVKAVYVAENQVVKRGQLLAELDPADMEVAVAEARAAVAGAEAQLQAENPSVPITETTNHATLASTNADLVSARASASESRKAVGQIAAQLAQAQANDKTAQLDRHRAEVLIAAQAVPQAELDRQVNAAVASAANVDSIARALDAARDRATAQEARVATIESRVAEVRSNAPRQLEARRAAVTERQASLNLAKARLAQAELNLEYTKITAPADGIVGKKAIAVGDRVAPGQEVMAIAQTDSLWVTANFRETQLRNLRPGQPVEVYVDGLDVTLHATVESMGGATGSRYSVLPPENATGNYVKVVQRLPVRLRLDPGQPGLGELRPGLSVEPKVRVR